MRASLGYNILSLELTLVFFFFLPATTEPQLNTRDSGLSDARAKLGVLGRQVGDSYNAALHLVNSLKAAVAAEEQSASAAVDRLQSIRDTIQQVQTLQSNLQSHVGTLKEMEAGDQSATVAAVAAAPLPSLDELFG